MNPSALSLARLKVLAIGLGLFSALVANAEVEDESAAVRRLDPRTGEFVPIDPERVQPGKISNHHSARHGRYVWAFAAEQGGFSYALGPGTTETPSNFDLAVTYEELDQLIESRVGAWARRSRLLGSDIKVRLNADGEWGPVPNASIRSHYDLDTRRRWEWHGPRKIAVSHTNGYAWRYDGQWYAPANRWSPSACCGR